MTTTRLYFSTSQEYSPRMIKARRQTTSVDLPDASNVKVWPIGVRIIEVFAYLH